MVFDGELSICQKVHFQKMLSVTLTFEPLTLKMLSVLCRYGTK